MSAILLAVLVVAAPLVAVIWPLFGRPPQDLGRGLEDDGPLRRWEAERDRLIAAMRDNDLALAEGRLDIATRDRTAAQLASEAETVLARLRRARSQLEPRQEPETGGRPRWLANAAMLCLTLTAGLGAAEMARWQDIDLTGSPHADGSIPLDLPAPEQPAASPPVMTADGTPDIGAMVARLETRVAEGGASAGDIKMLLRSYDTLGRLTDAKDVLDIALQRFPDDPDFQIGWLRAIVSLSRTDDAARGLAVADRLIATMPDLLEARWYRSLLLVSDHRPDEARVELMWLLPRLPAESPAHDAVTQLLTELDRSSG